MIKLSKQKDACARTNLANTQRRTFVGWKYIPDENVLTMEYWCCYTIVWILHYIYVFYVCPKWARNGYLV